MFNRIFCFLSITGIQICLSNNLQWNTKKPFKYTGYIYADSQVATTEPTLQVLVTNGEEICNFIVSKTQFNKETINFNPFRAIVKSAHLGLGELELLPNISLKNRTNLNFNLTIKAEACHNPDRWTDPAEIDVTVLDPPGPLWSKSQYSVSISNDASIGSFVVKVKAYLPPSADLDNKICQYQIQNSFNSPFTIDGDGTITTHQNLLTTETETIVLEVSAEDCSLPLHRKSQVKVFVTINPTCKFGWIGFYKSLHYVSGSGVVCLGKKPQFQFCYKKSDKRFSDLVTNCKDKKNLRVTVSVELKSVPFNRLESRFIENNVCNLDYESLKLQRKVCDIEEKKLLDLLTILSKQKTGVMKFPLQTNVFPRLFLEKERKFSLYFWMRRKTLEQMSDDFIICQFNEFGDNIFSVSISHCNLKIYFHSYHDLYGESNFNHSQRIIWESNLPQTCDDKWHHYLILIYQPINNSPNTKIRVFVDTEIIEQKNKNPSITPIQFIKTRLLDKNNVYIGQCSRNSNDKFQGYLAGFMFLPNILLKGSHARCLMKCMERLHFNGMNQMNPGMSVSLNSEMQTIIINGHNVEEVTKLVNVIGYANPKLNPIPGSRMVSIKTDMTCDQKILNIPPVEVNINVTKKEPTFINQQLITSINIFSPYKYIYISNLKSIQSNTGVGMGIFENTTLTVEGILQTTMEKQEQDTLTISRCIVSIHPELVQEKEYLEWPQQAIETVKTKQNSIEVKNYTKKIIFFGEYNYEIYQFIIQHIRYFSSVSPSLIHPPPRKFQLQCSTDVGVSIVNSNTLVVKVGYTEKDESDKLETTPKKLQDFTKAPDVKTSFALNDFEKEPENIVRMPAHSNAASIIENGNHREFSKKLMQNSTKINKSFYMYFFGGGILILVLSLMLMVRKLRRVQTRNNCILSFGVVDYICFPLQSIKEKIKPNSTVRVELSRDFLHRTSAKRRDIGLEMQWDDTELKSNSKYHIIENPIYEKANHEFDDNYLNNDVPPVCENEDFTTDDETENDTDVETNEKVTNSQESIMKKRLIDL